MSEKEAIVYEENMELRERLEKEYDDNVFVKKQSPFYVVGKRLLRNKVAMGGLVCIILLILLAIAAPLIAPFGYEEQNLFNILQPPSTEHIMGTDNLGRDVFSRLLHGGRISLRIGMLAVVVGTGLGAPIGAIAGFYGGKIDLILMRLIDVIQAIPPILLAIAVAAALGPGIDNAIFALGISTSALYARIMRSSVLSVRGMEYIEAAVAINAKDRRIILKHVIPNAISPLIVQMTMGVAQAILVAATLSFLGLGAQPPLPEWGAMLAAGRAFIRDSWHLVWFPGLAIMIAVLSLNMLGDGLRDALDPRLKS